MGYVKARWCVEWGELAVEPERGQSGHSALLEGGLDQPGFASRG